MEGDSSPNVAVACPEPSLPNRAVGTEQPVGGSGRSREPVSLVQVRPAEPDPVQGRVAESLA